MRRLCPKCDTAKIRQKFKRGCKSSPHTKYVLKSPQMTDNISIPGVC